MPNHFIIQTQGFHNLHSHVHSDDLDCSPPSEEEYTVEFKKNLLTNHVK